MQLRSVEGLRREGLRRRCQILFDESGAVADRIPLGDWLVSLLKVFQHGQHAQWTEEEDFLNVTCRYCYAFATPSQPVWNWW